MKCDPLCFFEGGDDGPGHESKGYLAEIGLGYLAGVWLVNGQVAEGDGPAQPTGAKDNLEELCRFHSRLLGDGFLMFFELQKGVW